MATYSSNTTIAWAGPLQSNSGSNITFTVPAGTFFKGFVGFSASCNSLTSETLVGIRIRNTNVSGSIQFANSRVVTGYNGTNNASATDQIGIAEEITLGAGTYYLEHIIFAALGGNPSTNINIQRFFVTGQLYQNTP